MPVFFRTISTEGVSKRLEGRRIYLRRPEYKDWAQWSNLREISREFLTPWEPTWLVDELTRTAFKRRLRRYKEYAYGGTGYTFFSFNKEDDCLLGGLTLSNIRRGVTQSCSLGYWTGKPFSGKGFMQEAVEILLPFVFEELKLHRLEAACLPNNEPSKAVLRNIGFSEEGYAREYLRINGRWSDHLLFGMISGEHNSRSQSKKSF